MRSSLPSLITLTTDFGLADGYVGIMKGVIQGICPGAVVVDLSHDIPPQDVRGAAFLLHTAHPYFPPGTVHVAVVDPGVGTERRAIALRTRRAFFVAPDNGLLSFIVANEPVEEIVHLNNPDYWLPRVSDTFHGRDIFAPVGAHLARGVPLRMLGEPIADMGELVTFPLPRPRRRPDGTIVVQVLHVDRFGNLATNLPLERREEGGEVWLEAYLPEMERPVVFRPWELMVYVGGQEIRDLRRAYAEGRPGEPIALIGSAGYLEIAVTGGNAAHTFGTQVGEEITVKITRLTPHPDDTPSPGSSLSPPR
jgi:hypothetical protein